MFFLKWIKAFLVVFKIGPERVLRLVEETRRDYLTGLLNRRGFEESLGIEVERLKRYGKIFSVLYLDMDDLKLINDSQGHHMGDRAIIAIAKIIQDILRITDFAGRVGGDEFIIVLPETNEQGAMSVIKRIKEKASNISIGYSSFYDGLVVKEVIRTAESRMYKDKRERKGVGE